MDFAGRVVFVGQSELINLHDDGFVTAFSRADGVDLSGVEIAATAFANLLDGHLLEPLGPGLSVALLVAFGLAIGGVGGALHAPIAVSATSLLAGSYYAATALVFARHNLWLPVVTPLLVQLPLGLFLGLLLQYRDAQRARTNISRAMGYYLPRAVTRGFAEDALDPKTLKAHVFAVCMVTDASRFTTLAEAMTPAELSEFLDRYFAILFGVVERHGGVVTDVVGDGTTSVWTAPGPERSCRLRACLAALEISHAIEAFNERNQPRTMPTRIGLNAGDAMVGNVGGSGRFAYSVVGDYREHGVPAPDPEQEGGHPDHRGRCRGRGARRNRQPPAREVPIVRQGRRPVRSRGGRPRRRSEPTRARAGFRRRAPGFLRGAARVRGRSLGRGRGALRYDPGGASA